MWKRVKFFWGNKINMDDIIMFLLGDKKLILEKKYKYCENFPDELVGVQYQWPFKGHLKALTESNKILSNLRSIKCVLRNNWKLSILYSGWSEAFYSCLCWCISAVWYLGLSWISSLVAFTRFNQEWEVEEKNLLLNEFTALGW